MKSKIATIFGGTGFVGTQIVRELAKRGYTIKVATRVPERAYFLRPCGVVGQVVPVACNYRDQESLDSAIHGSDVVINCIGILYERGKRQTFQKIHVDVPRMIATSCLKLKVERFVHISALGVDTGISRYAQSKRAGEQAVLENYPNATILRPSVIFGEGDSFFNMFAKLIQLLPALPLIGGGKTRFQPIYVGDVADACMAALELPALGETNPQGKIYELGGPDVVDFKAIYEILFAQTLRRRSLVPLPFWFAKIEASFLALFPKPLLTPDQVESLKTDTIVNENALKLGDLGLSATSMELILPRYLESYRPGGRFAS